MSLIVPDVYKSTVLDEICNQTLSLRLYGNNFVPASNTILANLIEIGGGGYSAVPLMFANWTIGATGIATYIPVNFNFSSAISGAGEIYGYYITDSLSALVLAERFPALVVPFVPTGGSLVRITPRIQVTS